MWSRGAGFRVSSGCQHVQILSASNPRGRRVNSQGDLSKDSRKQGFQQVDGR